MKQIMTISAALLFLTIGEVQAQNGIEQVLKNIETNNKELQANEQLITSQKLELSRFRSTDWDRHVCDSPV